MYDPIETFEVDGLTVEIHPDWDDPSSPKDWDTLGTLVAFPPLWREYGLGHRESTGQEDEAYERGGMRLLRRYLSITENAILIPVRFHDYGSSGSRLDESHDDDERVSAFFYTTPKRVRELCGDPVRPFDKLYAPADWTGTPEAWIESQLRGELRDWSSYVEGAVVGVVVKDERGKVLESVWGFYPDDQGDGLDYVREDGREIAEAARDERLERRRNTAQGWLAAHRREQAPA